MLLLFLAEAWLSLSPSIHPPEAADNVHTTVKQVCFKVAYHDLDSQSDLIMFLIHFYQLGNEEFTKMVDSIREKHHGGPYCRAVSEVPVEAVLSLQPDDKPEVVCSIVYCTNPKLHVSLP